MAAVSSSERSTTRLRSHGIRVLDVLPREVPVYIDGADEIDHGGHMIKGGGGALTREKIVSDIAQRFVCIADESKLVTTLGGFGLPIEIIPMAVGSVSDKVSALGGTPVLRAGYVTDTGGHIIDAKGLCISDPVGLEQRINQWAGVVTVGLFAQKKASVCLLGTSLGVKTLAF
jgi:ribose 5-phosphate isomerase A